LDVLISSDLHFGASARGDAAVRALALEVLGAPAEALVLAGDLAEGETALETCLSLFADFPGKKLAIPGNHDVWLRGHRARDSWHLHEEVLPEVFAKHGFHPLHLSPMKLGDLALVGSMGWYDYSFRDDLGIPHDAYVSKVLPPMSRPIWNDARYARFDETDEGVTTRLAARLSAHLQSCAGASEVFPIVHHVVTKELLVHPRELVPRVFRFANAFLGAERFSEILLADPRVRISVNGHIHRDKKIVRKGVSLVTLGASHRAKVLVRVRDGAVVSRQEIASPLA
jgi:predicted phosphohydrolase